MATYNVKGPDGTMYTVEGPNDATDEELINSVLRRLETEKRIDVPDNPIPDPNKAMMQDEDAFVKMQEIDNLKQEVASIFTRLGQLSVEKKRRIDEVEKVESDLLNQHQELVEKEKQIFAGLNEKYGDGNYDPNTNEFTPIEKEEAKSKEVKK